jgi:hypothetical protein
MQLITGVTQNTLLHKAVKTTYIAAGGSESNAETAGTVADVGATVFGGYGAYKIYKAQQLSTVVVKEVQFGENILSTIPRTSTKYGNSVEVLFKNGNKMDINLTRVKEWIPQLHPNAPIGTFQKVKFENFIINSKGYKRLPTSEEIDFFNSIFN